MKKFEIVKTTAEISWKERNEIKEGCTMYDVDPEKIASFGTKEEAEKELKKYKTDVCASGSLFTVEEFSIQENEYDEDGEWIGGGDIKSRVKMARLFYLQKMHIIRKMY